VSDSFALLHDPPDYDLNEPWYHWIPILGWICGYSRQVEREGALVDQAVKRGAVDESAWDRYNFDKEIRQKVEAIVLALAFPKGSTFHPHDPVELMFVLRYGDLNEVQIMMALEDELGFSMDEEMCNRVIQEKTTFIEFIKMVEEANLTSK
jgi:hypothetical protein